MISKDRSKLKYRLFVANLLIFFQNGILAADILEGCEHRTFQVGQGSCHTALYSVKKSNNAFYKTLVFCDIGSSSRAAPTKLSFHDGSFDNPIFQAKISQALTKDTLKKVANAITTKPHKKKSETSSDTAMTTEHKEPFAVAKMTQEIEDAVKGVDSFIVMLTHPDKDHINLYTDIFTNVIKPDYHYLWH